MAAQVGRHDMKIRAQGLRQMVPTAGVIEAAMHQQQRRRRRITPIGEMKAKALGLVVARLWRVRCKVHGACIMAGGARVQRGGESP